MQRPCWRRRAASLPVDPAGRRRAHRLHGGVRAGLGRPARRSGAGGADAGGAFLRIPQRIGPRPGCMPFGVTSPDRALPHRPPVRRGPAHEPAAPDPPSGAGGPGAAARRRGRLLPRAGPRSARSGPRSSRRQGAEAGGDVSAVSRVSLRITLRAAPQGAPIAPHRRAAVARRDAAVRDPGRDRADARAAILTCSRQRGDRDMSYGGFRALQAAVYQHLGADTALAGLVGAAIYDAMPAGHAARALRDAGAGEGARPLGRQRARAPSTNSPSASCPMAAASRRPRPRRRRCRDALVDAPLTLARGRLVCAAFPARHGGPRRHRRHAARST